MSNKQEEIRKLQDKKVAVLNYALGQMQVYDELIRALEDGEKEKKEKTNGSVQEHKRESSKEGDSPRDIEEDKGVPLL